MREPIGFVLDLRRQENVFFVLWFRHEVEVWLENSYPLHLTDRFTHKYGATWPSGPGNLVALRTCSRTGAMIVMFPYVYVYGCVLLVSTLLHQLRLHVVSWNF